MAREEIVSNASEQLILVDEHDRELGFKAQSATAIPATAFCTVRSRSSSSTAITSCCCSNAARARCCGRATGRTRAARIRAAAKSMARRRHAPARAGARFRVSARVSLQVQVPSAVWRRSAPSTSCARCISAVTTAPSTSTSTRSPRGGSSASRRSSASSKRTPETFTPWFKMEWVHIKANYLDGMLASTGTDG